MCCARFASTRRAGRALPAAVLLLGLLAGCVADQRRNQVQFETEPWKFSNADGTKITTEHYEIFTTLKDKVLIEALPGFVEGSFQQYEKLVPPVREPEERMKVYLFVSRGQWIAFTKRFTGARARVFLQIRNGGYSEQGVSVIQYVAHQITFPLFAHEGWHQYLYSHVNATVTAWLNEGLAVLCEGQRWSTYGLKEFDAWYNPARRNDLADALISNRLYPLRKLLQTHAGEVIEGSSRSVATYYAQLWALMLFLRDGEKGKYAADFQHLLAALGRPELDQQVRAGHIWSERDTFSPGEALFRAYISEDLDTVEREYDAFMRARVLGAR